MLKNKICPNCEEANLKLSQKDSVTYKYKNRDYDIGSMTVWICSNCDEEVTEGREIERVENIARDKHNQYIEDLLFQKSDVQVNLRMPKKLKEEVEKVAKADLRKPQAWIKRAIAEQLK